jgi:hypothetical protein
MLAPSLRGNVLEWCDGSSFAFGRNLEEHCGNNKDANACRGSVALPHGRIGPPSSIRSPNLTNSQRKSKRISVSRCSQSVETSVAIRETVALPASCFWSDVTSHLPLHYAPLPSTPLHAIYPSSFHNISTYLGNVKPTTFTHVSIYLLVYRRRAVVDAGVAGLFVAARGLDCYE